MLFHAHDEGAEPSAGLFTDDFLTQGVELDGDLILGHRVARIALRERPRASLSRTEDNGGAALGWEYLCRTATNLLERHELQPFTYCLWVKARPLA